MNESRVIEQVKCWLASVVIEHNICPFAKREFDRDSIHYVVSENNNIESDLELVFDEFVMLDGNSDVETSLIIFPQRYSDFDNYLDLFSLASQLLLEQEYEGIYQLASFHPGYCFEGEPENDPANYTNRSPYPIIHVIREASLEEALKHYPHPEKIPEDNIALTRKLGNEYFQNLLARCMQ